MKCPNCGRPMTKYYCIFCGYQNNGTFIGKKVYPISDLEKVLDNDYDFVLRNKCKIIYFFLGPLYLCYRNYLWVGVLLYFLDIIGFMTIPIFIYYLLNFMIPPAIINMFYFIFNRMIWMGCTNLIYINLLNKKINKLKKKYNKDYKKYLEKIRCRNVIKLFLGIVLVIIIPKLFIIACRYFMHLFN